MGRIDVNLFIYLTKASGHDLSDVAELWGVGVSAVYKRLKGEVELRRSEMDSWMRLVGVTDAGPVFFSGLVANTLHPGEQASD
ncbi:MAG: hypothetical protein IKY65_04655 [Rikenellaceae bacterium]|nr:hypothetical protein [Rikenellaceae bacterium]